MPVSDAPEMVYGSKPTDGGNLLLSIEDKDALLAEEPTAAKWIRPFLGAEEFLNGLERFCLWLVDCPPDALRKLPVVLRRVDAVRAMRALSPKASTREKAQTPAIFAELRQPSSLYLAVPEVSSENRRFLPIGYLGPEVIASNKLYAVANASIYHFGVLTSGMHNAWMRAVCGRLESRYQYSASIVYNTFPWPEPTNKERAAIEASAQGVLDARAAHPGASLADLYDPLTMPPDLVKAHQILDRAVDAAYGYKGTATDAAHVAFLFGLYQQLTSLLPAKSTKARRSSKAAR